MRGMTHYIGGDCRSRSLLWLIQSDRAITQILDLYAIFTCLCGKGQRTRRAVDPYMWRLESMYA